MRTLVFVHGGKVKDGAPVAHFLLRLEAAADYHAAHPDDDVSFLVSGRWPTVSEEFEVSEAEVGKRWLLARIPDATVMKEDVSVELIGNVAFSKPLITSFTPDTVIIPTSLVLKPRFDAIIDRIWGDDIRFIFEYVTSERSEEALMLAREAAALTLFTNVFGSLQRGDDAAFRDRLLYGTPYYFKSLMDDREYFDRYWDGGYDAYLESRLTYQPDWRPDGRP